MSPPRPRAPVCFLLVTLSLLHPGSARAEAGLSLLELHSARTYGLAGNGRALGLGNDVSGGNPAALSLWPTYRIELTGAWDWHNKDAVVGVNLADATAGPIAAGVAYHLVKLDRGEAQRVAHVTNLGLSLPLAQSFHLGFSTRYVVLRGPVDRNKITADAGVMLRPTSALLLGAAAHNILDTQMPELPRSYTLHAAIIGGSLGIAADARATRIGGVTGWEVGGAAEYQVTQGFPLRVGYRYDTRLRTSMLGVGLGLLSPSGGIDVGYEHDFSARGARLIALTFRIGVK